jgi:hypothetical protein
LNATVTYNIVDTANYSFAGSNTNTSTVTGVTISKALVNVTGITAADKVYDGNANASVNSSSLTGFVHLGNSTAANGSTISNVLIGAGNVTANGTFQGLNATNLALDVGQNKNINISYALADTANYTMTSAASANVTTANITMAASSTWIGAGNVSNYSDAANWLNGVIADASNVGNVTIQAGTTATFDAGARATNLQSITGAVANFTQTGSTMNVSNGAGTSVARFTQTGGIFTGNTNLTASTLFNQTGGSIDLTGAAVVSINGATNLNNIQASVINIVGTDIVSTGTVRASTTVIVNATSSLNNTASGLICGDMGTTVTGGAITNAGTIGCTPAATNISGASLDNTGAIAGSNISINVTGNVTNSGNITGTGNVSITGGNITNTAPGNITGNGSTNLTVGTNGTISNNGTVGASGNTSLTGGNITNTNPGVIGNNNGSTNVTGGNLTNNGTINGNPLTVNLSSNLTTTGLVGSITQALSLSNSSVSASQVAANVHMILLTQMPLVSDRTLPASPGSGSSSDSDFLPTASNSRFDGVFGKNTPSGFIPTKRSNKQSTVDIFILDGGVLAPGIASDQVQIANTSR